MNRADPAERFRALHVPGDPLVLVNVWDVVGRVTPVGVVCRVSIDSSGIAVTDAALHRAATRLLGGGEDRRDQTFTLPTA